MVINGEVAGERIMWMLREGHWLQEEGEEEGMGFQVLDTFGRPASPSPYVSQTFTMGATIARLSQNLTREMEEAIMSEEDIDMPDTGGGMDSKG